MHAFDSRAVTMDGRPFLAHLQRRRHVELRYVAQSRGPTTWEGAAAVTLTLGLQPADHRHRAVAGGAHALGRHSEAARGPQLLGQQLRSRALVCRQCDHDTPRWGGRGKSSESSIWALLGCLA
jgi:hypothetical protein